MKRRFALLVILAVLLLCTTGCWDRRELNELAITLAIGLDSTEDGQYLVTAQVVNPGTVAAKDGSSHSPVVIFQAKGETVLEAFRQMTKESPRRIYPSHLRLLVIGESLAKEGILKPLDLLSRDWELRSDFYVVVAKDMDATDILKVPTALEKIPANNLFDSLTVSANAWSVTSSVTLDEFASDIISDGKQPVLTGIQAFGKKDEESSLSIQNLEMIDSPARIRSLTLAAFKEDKLVGWLSESESRTYNKINNNVKSTIVNVPCPDGGTAAIQVISAKADVKGKVINGKPKVDVHLRAVGNVGEVDCNLDLTKLESLEQLKKAYEKKSIQKMEEAIQNVQDNIKVDIFGFGEVIHRDAPKAWKQLKKDWDKEFQDLSVDVKYDIHIRRIGTKVNSLLEKSK